MSEIKPWPSIRQNCLLEHRLFDIQETTAVSPYTAKQHPFIFLDSQDWVNIVPITAQNQLIMIEQYRHGSQSITLEIPGGMIDAGEKPEVAAKRECLEESGYETKQVISLGQLLPNPAILNNRLHTFYSLGAEYVGTTHKSTTENTAVVAIDFDDVQKLMLEGRINHALVCATLWRLIALRREFDLF